MRVSVAIATYNRAGMVRQAIEAALEQTRPPEEIVVADDASTDSTWAALNELAGCEPRVRIFRRERNSGGVENWSFAIGQTRGDYIAWCSDDDRFTPGSSGSFGRVPGGASRGRAGAFRIYRCDRN